MFESCLGLGTYVHPFRRNSLFCSRKSQKKSPEAPVFGIQGHYVNSTNK